MRKKMRENLWIVIAAALMIMGMQIPAEVKAQESGQQTGSSRTVERAGEVTVTTPEAFKTALAQHKSPIIVSGLVTVGDTAEEGGRMIPINIPAGTEIRGSGKPDDHLNFRSPVQLQGDGVCFKDIKMTFESSDALGSVPHREIFLAGHSLVLDNVGCWLDGGDGQFGGLGGNEKELLPTVYAGGFTGAAVGSNASLTVRNSNDKTIFQAIYMGHDKGNDNKVPYMGNCVLNLDDKAVVRDRIDVALNTRADITLAGPVNRTARAEAFYGNENTTLTVDTISVEKATVDGVGNIVLKNGACLSPVTESLRNITLQNGACLDFSSVGEARITGNFTGESDAAKKGILVMWREGSLQIGGQITGITQFQTGSRLFPGILLPDRTYITASPEKAIESNFELAQKSIDTGYVLKYSNGVWKTDPRDTSLEKEIGEIEIASAPSKVDLRKLTLVDDEEIPEGNPYFEIKWYDKSGEEFTVSEIEGGLYFYDIGQVICIKTEYWNSDAQDVQGKTDWLQWVTLSTLPENPGRYYLRKCKDADTGEVIEVKPGDYTFLFLDSLFGLGDLTTVADVKDLKNNVGAQWSVTFNDQDAGGTDKPEHTHSYQSAVTKQATCTEKGVKTFTCECGDKYTESINALGHREVTDPAVKPTETTAGKTEGSHCSACGAVIRKQEVIPALGKPEHTHSYQSAVTKKATCTEKGIITYTCGCGDKYTKELSVVSHKYTQKISPATAKCNGKVQQICQVCSAAKSTVIYKPQKPALSKTDYNYDGKVKTPSVTVKDSKGKYLKKNTDFKVVYPKGRKNPGVYTVTVELRGKYSGKMTGSFTIKPKKTSLKKVTAKSKGMQVTWNKQKTQIDGYQIQYCTSGKFKGKTLKTVTAKKNDTSKKISKLKGKTKYYVRIRTYKTVKVSGKSKKLYSDWSGKKTVKTKK